MPQIRSGMGRQRIHGPAPLTREVPSLVQALLGWMDHLEVQLCFPTLPWQAGVQPGGSRGGSRSKYVNVKRDPSQSHPKPPWGYLLGIVPVCSQCWQWGQRSLSSNLRDRRHSRKSSPNPLSPATGTHTMALRTFHCLEDSGISRAFPRVWRVWQWPGHFRSGSMGSIYSHRCLC